MEKDSIIMKINYTRDLFLPTFSTKVSWDDIVGGASTGGLYNVGKGLFGGGGRGNSIDTTSLMNAIREGAMRQRNDLNYGRQSLYGLSNPYQQSITDALGQFKTDSNKSAQDFLKSVGQTAEDKAKSDFSGYTQQIMGQLPTLQRAITERTAAGPGVGSGANLALQQDLASKTSGELAGAAGKVESELQDTMAKAEGQVFGAQQNAIANVLGVNVDTAKNIYSTMTDNERQLLADQLGIDKNELDQTLQVNEFALGGDLASQLASDQSRNAFLSQLLGLGGTLGGFALMRR